MAREHGISVLEWMEIDPRTFADLLRRAGVPELFDGRLPTAEEFIQNQQLVSNPVLLKAVQRICFDREPEAHVKDASTLE